MTIGSKLEHKMNACRYHGLPIQIANMCVNQNGHAGLGCITIKHTLTLHFESFTLKFRTLIVGVTVSETVLITV